MSNEPDDLVFEPHAGYGRKIDGEPMPFGYISGRAPRRVIFELNPLLKIPRDSLTKTARQMAASGEMLDLLHRNLNAWEDEEESVQEEHHELIKDLRTFLEGK